MHPLIVTLTLLGRAFYERPAEENRDLYQHLAELPNMLQWPNAKHIAALIADLPTLTLEEHEYQYSVLFEGQGHMACPPWGSVYLDRHNMVFGETTHHYEAFLTSCNLALEHSSREPQDQFGLMLLALSQLLINEQHSQAVTLLEDHLFTWCFRYLQLLAANETSRYYAILASVAETLLGELKAEFEISVQPVELFF